MGNNSAEAQLLQTELNVEVDDPNSDDVLEMEVLTALSAAAHVSPDHGKKLFDDLTDEILFDLLQQYSKVKLIF